MSVVRILIYLAIAGLVLWGIRRIWLDWTKAFRKVDDDDRAARRARDLRDRQRPDVVELERDADGTFRPREPDHRR